MPPVPDRETGHAAPEPFYEPLINSKMVADVPLTGLSFIVPSFEKNQKSVIESAVPLQRIF